MRGAAPVVGEHHEKYDGSGYPLGLRGEGIHIHARIFAVADAFDAITTDRPYRNASSYTQARREIISSSGIHFDPVVVDKFLAVPESEWGEIRKIAKSEDYIEHLIGKHEIRSFVISLKRDSGFTGPVDGEFADRLARFRQIDSRDVYWRRATTSGRRS